MNSVIEIHDSKIVGVMPSAGSIVVRMSPAYVHRSEGRPGFDSGSVWVQDIELTISDFELESNLPELPQELDGGSIQLGSQVFENIIPLPLDVRGAIRFSVLALSGESLIIQGSGATVVLLGEPRYVEQFSGNR
jgi:hypothetical protein